MTVGMPGTGIGGMFYMLSALCMPLRELSRRARGAGAPSRWRLALRQAAIAAGSLAGIGVTGWLLGILISASPAAVATHWGSRAAGAPNVVRTAALVISVGTLVGVLLGVELLRLLVRRRVLSRAALHGARRRPVVETTSRPRERVLVKRRAAAGARITLLLFLGGDTVRVLSAQSAARPRPASEAARWLARADSALEAGDSVVAAREYGAVLAADHTNSRATFRLAQLSQRTPAEALRLFARYVTLEPSDPWGYLAVGDELARSGRNAQALRWYAAAVRLAPGERNAVVGHARLLARAGRTDACIAAYEAWVAAHPADAEVWRELGREQLRAGRPGTAAQAFAHALALAPDGATTRHLTLARAQAAPALEPTVGGSHDSDGNVVRRFGAAADVAAGDRTRFGAAFMHEKVGDGLTSTTVEELSLRASSRPTAGLTVNAAAGGARLDVGAGPAAGTIIPTGMIRARWRAAATGSTLELRAQHGIVDATPLLVANRLTRTELRGMLQLPAARWLKLRGIGRTAALRDDAASNRRTILTGVVAIAATPSVEVSGQFHQMGYAHPSTTGYFAPRLAQTVEAGSYMEFETARSLVLALDLGAGAQRVAEHGASVGPWRSAFRLYSLIVAPLQPGRALQLEVEGYDGQIGSDVAASPRWRYWSAALSLRWALRG
jgi:cytochrome c-type biogenesis protein CcmH/NrfG